VYDLNLDLEAMLPKRGANMKGRKELSLSELRESLKVLDKNDTEWRRLTMELHRRFSIPFACVVLGFIAVPLGAGSEASGRSWGIILALMFFLVYYTMLSSVWSLGETGIFPAALGTWIPNIILGTIAPYMIVKTANESPIFIMSLVNKAFHAFNRLKNRFQ
jgi:lipopolysaccharide export system permease protein